MICTRCLRLRLRLSSPPLSHRLPYSTTRSPPPATSTSAAQPFSTPFTPSPYPSTSPTHPPRSPPQQQQRQEPQSSLKAGTPLKGLALEKNKEVPVAREDGEYPAWLWGLLGKREGTEGEVEGKGGGDAFCGFLSFFLSLLSVVFTSYPFPWMVFIGSLRQLGLWWDVISPPPPSPHHPPKYHPPSPKTN